MKLLYCLAACTCLSSALSQVPAAISADSSFLAFVLQFDEAHDRFVNGDAVLWKQNCSQRDDATIFGAFGGYEKGWKEVGARYDWAASRFKKGGSRVTVEYLSSAVHGDMAYTVAIERSTQHRVNQDKPTPVALRVTHIFRKEAGVWKMVHRHADPLMERKSPDAAPMK